MELVLVEHNKTYSNLTITLVQTYDIFICESSKRKFEFTGSNQILEFIFIYRYSRTCLIRHIKGPRKCVRLYRMSKNSGSILVNRNTLGPYIFVGCHRMSENSGVGLHKFYRNNLRKLSIVLTLFNCHVQPLQLTSTLFVFS